MLCREGRDSGCIALFQGFLSPTYRKVWLFLTTFEANKKRPTSSLGLSNKNNKMMIISTGRTVFFYCLECDKNDLVSAAATI